MSNLRRARRSSQGMPRVFQQTQKSAGVATPKAVMRSKPIGGAVLGEMNPVAKLGQEIVLTFSNTTETAKKFRAFDALGQVAANSGVSKDAPTASPMAIADINKRIGAGKALVFNHMHCVASSEAVYSQNLSIAEAALDGDVETVKRSLAGALSATQLSQKVQDFDVQFTIDAVRSLEVEIPATSSLVVTLSIAAEFNKVQ